MITTEAAPKLTRNEGLKTGNPLLTGTIAQTLADASAERFTDEDYEFLKFHGIYQQDDRDQRKVANSVSKTDSNAQGAHLAINHATDPAK